mmetsp:Transcript_1436/g.5177  ORF Transcript_1436/g.5177 Transcript_1436/m.5177 type:complete len:261 (+) Transcript_1436:1250-2032(+)
MPRRQRYRMPSSMRMPSSWKRRSRPLARTRGCCLCRRASSSAPGTASRPSKPQETPICGCASPAFCARRRWLSRPRRCASRRPQRRARPPWRFKRRRLKRRGCWPCCTSARTASTTFGAPRMTAPCKAPRARCRRRHRRHRTLVRVSFRAATPRASGATASSAKRWRELQQRARLQRETSICKMSPRPQEQASPTWQPRGLMGPLGGPRAIRRMWWMRIWWCSTSLIRGVWISWRLYFISMMASRSFVATRASSRAGAAF